MSQVSHLIPGTRIQYAWDSTSLGTFIQCPRKYELSILEGWQTRYGRVELSFGIAYHKALERYEKFQLIENLSPEDAMRKVIRLALAEAKGQPFDWFLDDEGNRTCIDTKRTPFTLIRAIVWYFETFDPRSDPAQTIVLSNGKPAIELSARIELDSYAAEGYKYILSGHLDRLTVWNKEPVFLDRKTTKTTLSSQYFENYNLDVQMDIYYILGRVAFSIPVKGGIIDAVQLAVGFARFERGLLHRRPKEVEESLSEMQYYMRLARSMAEAGTFVRNKKACFLCEFKKVCAQPADIRPLFLEADYIKRERPWNPLESR